jgi:hypothetical protein
MASSLSGKSLDAATATGAGSALTFHVPQTRFSMHVKATGSPTACVVRLEGSVDGSFFASILEIDLSGGGLPDPMNTWNVSATVAPFVAVRANLISLSGGSSPTVTANIAASV